MKRIAIAAGVALSLSGIPLAGSTAARPDKHVTLTGCVVKGDGGYLLMNAVDSSEGDSRASTVPVGASVAGRTFYWLADDHDVKDHAGHEVQLTGELDDHLDLGKVETERKGDDVELEFKVDGRKITVKVPDTAGAVATSGVTREERTSEFVVRKVDVKSVKMLASACR